MYAAIVREIFYRLRYHSRDENVDGILHGLKVIEPADFKIEGEDHLPCVSMIDATFGGGNGTVPGTITIFVKSSRKRGLFADLAEADAERGLMDWVAAVQDAIETAPSGGEDCLLKPHKRDGSPIFDRHNQHTEMLMGAIQWTGSMGGITPLSYLYELEMSWKVATNGNDRSKIFGDKYVYEVTEGLRAEAN